MDVLLVTTGATVAFDGLLREVVRRGFLEAVGGMGFRTVVVQYGAGRELVSELVDGWGLAARGDGWLGPVGPVAVRLFGFTQEVDKEVAAASCVVSHAGTGAILDVLRGGDTPLVVVSNDQLMDNHQVEIGQAFAAMGCVLYVGAVGEVEGAVKQVVGGWRGRGLPPPSLLASVL